MFAGCRKLAGAREWQIFPASPSAQLNSRRSLARWTLGFELGACTARRSLRKGNIAAGSSASVESQKRSNNRRNEHYRGLTVTLNVGSIDRLIRIVIGLVLIALGVFHVVTGTAAIVAYVVAAVAIITGVVRFCPAWAMFGINTSGSKTG